MPSPRKQRELEARSELILDVARKLLLERGFVGLSMDRIAAATEYSKGTIYQHFSCKEEVLVALALQTAARRCALFERAATYPGRPRERMLAMGVAAALFGERHPLHFRSEQTVLVTVREKVSADRQTELRGWEARCMGIACGVVRDGVACGDLDLPAGHTAEELAFGLWIMSYGLFAFQACHRGSASPHLGLSDPLETTRKNQQLLLDGYGWRPLTSEWDYAATRAGVLAHLAAPAEVGTTP